MWKVTSPNVSRIQTHGTSGLHFGAPDPTRFEAPRLDLKTSRANPLRPRTLLLANRVLRQHESDLLPMPSGKDRLRISTQIRKRHT